MNLHATSLHFAVYQFYKRLYQTLRSTKFVIAGKIKMYPKIYGHPIDAQTRCVHYHSTLDVIAIKFKCCQHYYPCHLCHEETADHPALTWNTRKMSEKAVLCGVCKTELTISEYLEADNQCPGCKTNFNPGCANHYHLYFAV